MTRFATPLVLLALAAGCSAPSNQQTSPAIEEERTAPVTPDPVVRGDASTNLETTPLSAADYAMYSAIMGGASAMLRTLTPQEREALELEKQVKAGAQKLTPQNQALLAQARALHETDFALARLQGIEDRYRQVKSRVEAAIGPDARPPAAGDAVARENLRYLEPNRRTIERLQAILRDPLSRPPDPDVER